MDDDPGMREEADPVGAEMRAVRSAAYAIVKRIDEFGRFWDEDTDALDRALAVVAKTAAPMGVAGLRIRPLDWSWDHHAKSWNADTPLGRYAVWDVLGVKDTAGMFHDSFRAAQMIPGSMDNAKAAAERHFAEALMVCFKPTAS